MGRFPDPAGAGGGNKPDLVETFTKAGLECIVRLYAHRPHPDFVVREDDVRAYVDAGAHTHTINATGVASPQTASGSTLPPYVALVYLMRVA